MIRGHQDGGVTALQCRQELTEKIIEQPKLLPRPLTPDPVLMGQGIEFGPVGIEIVAPGRAVDAVADLQTQSFDPLVTDPLGVAGEGTVETGTGQPFGHQQVAGHRQPLAERENPRQIPGAEDLRRDLQPSQPGLKRQHRQLHPEFGKPGEPAGESVLLGRDTGHEQRNRGGRGAGADRGQPRLQVPDQYPFRTLGAQKPLAQAVDHQQQDVAGPIQIVQHAIPQRLIAGPGASQAPADGGHQVDDAAAPVVRGDDGAGAVVFHPGRSGHVRAVKHHDCTRVFAIGDRMHRILHRQRIPVAAPEHLVEDTKPAALAQGPVDG